MASSDTQNEKVAAPAASSSAASATDKSAGKKRKRRSKRHVVDGAVHIHASFNNTIITFTDAQGDTLAWGTAGKAGFRGSKKSTPFAAQVALESLATYVRDEYGMKNVEVYVKGPGPGRESTLCTLGLAGLKITLITDKTPIAHNGTRPPKKRRV